MNKIQKEPNQDYMEEFPSVRNPREFTWQELYCALHCQAILELPGTVWGMNTIQKEPNQDYMEDVAEFPSTRNPRDFDWHELYVALRCQAIVELPGTIIIYFNE
ncbi:hypothetical protein AVEN_154219-1 [Araneus ventricosus]|uniref:Uncharacterized protein n=1 Tax=Araneus ventricosus TaxID=182803 RepID=A0A4Y2GV26_ARAVE|nr:hypothetical protein AVEN_154219-1 [Araneus ventricosus]